MTEIEFFGNSIMQWILAAALAVALIIAVGIVRRILGKRLKRLSNRVTSPFPGLAFDLVCSTRMWLVVPLALLIATQVLQLPARIERMVPHAMTVLLLLQAAFWANRVLLHVLSHNIERRLDRDAAGATTLAVVGFIGRLVLWSVIALLILGNLGFDITGLVAGLGIGGIAVALAAQNILGDLFASLSIALDKPFLIGDFIIVGDKMGTVEHIGIKTTRVRSLGGEQIIFSNTDLLNNAIRNYKRMLERRVVFSFGVVYETEKEKLAQIPAMVRRIVEAQAKSRFDRAHFKEFGDFALIYEIVYYVLSPDYNEYMDTQQAINLALFGQLQEAGIGFAYPTQQLYVKASWAGGVPT